MRTSQRPDAKYPGYVGNSVSDVIPMLGGHNNLIISY